MTRENTYENLSSNWEKLKDKVQKHWKKYLTGPKYIRVI